LNTLHESRATLISRRRNIPESISRSRSVTPSIDHYVERLRAEVYQQYDGLFRMGGRSSAPIQTDPGVWNPAVTDERLHISHHWVTEWRRTHSELERWKHFRRYQELKRRNTDEFDRYSLGILLYCQEQKDIQWNLKLEREPERQTKLDEWKEYYIYEHEKLKWLERKLQRVHQLPKEQQCLYGSLWRADNDLKIHRSLLDWIENEMSSVVADRESAKQDGKSRCAQQKEKTSLALPKSQSQKQIRGSRRNRLRITASAALKSVHASHVSKSMQEKKLLNPRRRQTSHNIALHGREATKGPLEQPDITGKAEILQGKRPTGSEHNNSKWNSIRSQRMRLFRSVSPLHAKQGPSSVADQQRSTLRRSARILERHHILWNAGLYSS